MKKCTKCLQTLPLEKFDNGYKKKDGTYSKQPRCKKCVGEYKKEHYLQNKQKYLDKSKKQREQDRDKYLKYLRDYYRQNKELLNFKAKQYSFTVKGKEVQRLSNRKYWNNPKNKLKNKARWSINNALKRGDIVKPPSCELCNLETKLEAHHTDYTKPFEVMWLCKKCHENIHHLNEGQVSIR